MSRLALRRTLRLPAAALAVVLIASGCATDDSRSTAAPTELRLAIGGESEEGYDPTLGWGRYGSPLFQSTLLKRNADLSIGTDLATDYSVSDDASSGRSTSATTRSSPTANRSRPRTWPTPSPRRRRRVDSPTSRR
ncbi:hypothetical protein [Nocardioides daphniae]|uniref:hypothetical protein n=1 Tax=Nocardioides daphniae TaxID=402297 RepID=UPI001EE8C420|nr:hypothetical protein [Nocardioides daphniae]